MSSVTYQGAAPTLDHSKFTLTITGSHGNNTLQYSVTGRPTGPSAWPASGTFTFGTDVKQELIRNDSNGDVPVHYNVTDTQLTMDFTFANENAYNAGRTANVGGDWTFTFTKQ